MNTLFRLLKYSIQSQFLQNTCVTNETGHEVKQLPPEYYHSTGMSAELGKLISNSGVLFRWLPRLLWYSSVLVVFRCSGCQCFLHAALMCGIEFNERGFLELLPLMVALKLSDGCPKARGVASHKYMCTSLTNDVMMCC